MAVHTNASSHTGDLYELCSRREIPSDDACFAAFIGRFMMDHHILEKSRGDM